jgi:branched-chain amino acid transport system permease protein
MSILSVQSASRGLSGLFSPALPKSHRRAVILPDTWAKRFIAIVTIVLLCALPLEESYYITSIAVAIAIGIIGAIATNLLVGVAGQATIGNSAFMAIGAFTAAQCGIYFHFPFVAAILASGIVSGVVGALVGIPAIRVRGLYLVVATLALFYVTTFVLTEYETKRVGVAGFTMPSVTFGSLSILQTWYFIIMFCAGLSIVVMRNLLRSRVGRAWASIARDEEGAAVMGVRVNREKVLVFCFTSFVIGVQGGLFAYYAGSVDIGSFTFDLAVSYIAMIVIGGIASVGGSVVGACFVVGLPYVVTAISQHVPSGLASLLSTRIYDVENVIYGIAIIIFLVWEPKGIISIVQKPRRFFSTWPLGSRLKVSDE